MKTQPYHKYVFDTKKRKFVGKFEEMYSNERKAGYDSWFQDDLTHLGKQLTLLLLDKYRFNSILDIGCGKGALTCRLKRKGNAVTGVDIAKTAVEIAGKRHKNIKFKNQTAEEALNEKRKYDLIIMMEILSYLKNWKEMLKKASKRTKYVYISLYIPKNPIGFVKKIDILRKTFIENFIIQTELVWNGETIFLLGKSKNAK